MKDIFKKEDFVFDQEEFDDAIDKVLKFNAFKVHNNIVTYIPPSRREKKEAKKEDIKISYSKKDIKIIQTLLNGVKFNRI